MKLVFSKTADELGIKAAEYSAKVINDAIAQKGGARIILSTGASQFTLLSALIKQDIDWSKVEIFHLDEYVGMDNTHPASFVKYIKERVVAFLPTLKAVYYLNATEGAERIIDAVTAELNKAPIDLGVIGIGENSHIAFNDPPADFDTQESFKIVELDDACRKQQLGEGWFPTLSDVPERAISMTVNEILKCECIVSAVPYSVKAEAIKKTFDATQPINTVPSSAFLKHTNVTIFVDEESASLIDVDNYL